MIKIIISSTFLLCCISLSAQKPSTIAFYNVENLFDTIDGTNDDAEFLPSAKNAWNSIRYMEKLKHIREVLNTAGKPLIAGFCEIENAEVVRDIYMNQKDFKSYALVHHDSKDARGIDVAMIYDKSKLTLVSDGIIRFVLPGDSLPSSRDILWAKFKHKKEMLFVMVNHWPSRRSGTDVSEAKRVKAAECADRFIDSLMKQDQNVKIIFMGDLNDYPSDKAPKIIESKLTPMILKSSGEFGGTYNYQGQWEIMDHIFVSTGLSAGKIKVVPSSGKIYSPAFLLDKYKGNIVPFRTYGGANYLGGYSDHLPVSISISLK